VAELVGRDEEDAHDPYATPPSGRHLCMPEVQLAALRVFLVDDHEVVLRGFTAILNSEEGVEVVGASGRFRDAIMQITDLEPDVAVMDVRLPDGDGIELCKEVLSRSPEIRCLMLTSFADDEALFAAVMAGASGYLLKDASSEDLINAVKTVGAGGSLLDPELATHLLERLRRGPFEEDERLSRLTKQERRILELVSDGMTNRQIAEAMFLAEATVKNYVSNLLAKLGLQRRTQAAILANELRRKNPAA
jgi:two-component system, NarL family, response regulator DevR